MNIKIIKIMKIIKIIINKDKNNNTRIKKKNLILTKIFIIKMNFQKHIGNPYDY